MKPQITVTRGTASPGELAAIVRQNLRTGLPYLRSSLRFRGGEECYRLTTTHRSRGRTHTTTTTFRDRTHAQAWAQITREHVR